MMSLHWRHERDDVSNHWRIDGLLNNKSIKAPRYWPLWGEFTGERWITIPILLQWRHNERDGVSNHWRLHCVLICWLRRRSKKKSQLRVTGLCMGNSPVTSEFSTQKASSAENSIWWRNHVIIVAVSSGQWHLTISLMQYCSQNVNVLTGGTTTIYLHLLYLCH